VLRANPSVPYDKRIEVARFIEDLTASYQAGSNSVTRSCPAIQQVGSSVLARSNSK
jgi:hypothetical protein